MYCTRTFTFTAPAPDPSPTTCYWNAAFRAKTNCCSFCQRNSVANNSTSRRQKHFARIMIFFARFFSASLHAKTLWTRVYSHLSRWVQPDRSEPAADCPSIAITLQHGGKRRRRRERERDRDREEKEAECDGNEARLGLDTLSVLGCASLAVSWQKRTCIFVWPCDIAAHLCKGALQVALTLLSLRLSKNGSLKSRTS